MSKTIVLTDEQYDALVSGEGVTLKALPPTQRVSTKWEPMSGRWFVDHEGLVGKKYASWVGRVKFGIERKTEKASEKAAEAMRIHNRLLAYVDEFDQGWDADWGDKEQKKYFLNFNYAIGEYLVLSSKYLYRIGCVYMSEECAEGLFRKLKSGEVEL